MGVIVARGSGRLAAVVALALSVATSGCAGDARPPAATVNTAATDASTCLELIDRLRRVRPPDTSRERRAALATLARTGRALETRFDLEAAPVVELYAAIARVRQEALHAIRDGRPTASRRLSVQARMLAIRAESLTAELAVGCP